VPIGSGSGKRCYKVFFRSGRLEEGKHPFVDGPRKHGRKIGLRDSRGRAPGKYRSQALRESSVCLLLPCCKKAGPEARENIVARRCKAKASADKPEDGSLLDITSALEALQGTRQIFICGKAYRKLRSGIPDSASCTRHLVWGKRLRKGEENALRLLPNKMKDGTSCAGQEEALRIDEQHVSDASRVEKLFQLHSRKLEPYAGKRLVKASHIEEMA
jgi:hypothetical protein